MEKRFSMFLSILVKMLLLSVFVLGFAGCGVGIKAAQQKLNAEQTARMNRRGYQQKKEGIKRISVTKEELLEWKFDFVRVPWGERFGVIKIWKSTYSKLPEKPQQNAQIQPQSCSVTMALARRVVDRWGKDTGKNSTVCVQPRFVYGGTETVGFLVVTGLKENEANWIRTNLAPKNRMLLEIILNRPRPEPSNRVPSGAGYHLVRGIFLRNGVIVIEGFERAREIISIYTDDIQEAKTLSPGNSGGSRPEVPSNQTQ